MPTVASPHLKCQQCHSAALNGTPATPGCQGCLASSKKFVFEQESNAARPNPRRSRLDAKPARSDWDDDFDDGTGISDGLSPPTLRPVWGSGGASDLWFLYRDREANPHFDDVNRTVDGGSFRVSMPQVIGLAQDEMHWKDSIGALPLPPKARVTDFSQWVFRLYDPGPRQESMAHGTRIERLVDSTYVSRRLTVFVERGWELIYRDPLGEWDAPLRIGSLTIAGRPLRGRPDLVFRRRKTGEIVVVERKASLQRMPSESWPNAKAQIWCYAQADIFIDAPEITLVIENWQEDWKGPRLERAVRWDAKNLAFNRDMSLLFKLYASQF